MPEDIHTMQQDAIRRAREMYRRAMPTPITESEEPVHKPDAENQDNYTLPTDAPQKMEGEAGNELTQDFLETFFKDHEKMLIIALLVILSKEECESSLLFSLMYLLL